jgi:hypothetical protein
VPSHCHVQKSLDLRVQVGRSLFVEREVFHGYARHILIPHIGRFRSANLNLNVPAILLLVEQNVKVITFPRHASGILQMVDLVSFDLLKYANRRIPRNSWLPLMQDRALRMFRAHEAAATCSTVRGSFKRPGFTYVKRLEKIYMLVVDEARNRTSPECQEVWKIDFPLQGLRNRRSRSPWRFINPTARKLEDKLNHRIMCVHRCSFCSRDSLR